MISNEKPVYSSISLMADNEKSAVTDFACNYQPMVQKNLYKTSYSIPGEVKNHYRNKTLSGVRSLSFWVIFWTAKFGFVIFFAFDFEIF